MKEYLLDQAFRQYRVDQARNYLEHVSETRRKVAALVERADTLRDLADGIRGMAILEAGATASPYADAIPDAVARLDELSRRASDMAVMYAEMVEECDVSLTSLGGWRGTLLDLHYLGGKTLAEIGEMDEWRHDRQYMSVLHIQALDAFYDHMPHYRREPMPPAI